MRLKQPLVRSALPIARVERLVGLLVLLGLVAVGGACSEQGAPQTESAAPDAPATPATESFAIPPLPSGSGQGQASLEWDVPEGWLEQPPSSPMRKAQYALPGPAGEGSCVVFYFGPGQGGGVDANIARWIGQFRGADGGSAEHSAQTLELDGGRLPVTIIEAHGTYVGGMGTAMGGADTPLADHRMLAAVARGPDANWFFKCLGPEQTMELHQAAFDAFIRSLRQGS
ncbi:MAG: hypothetical protein JSV80_14050 [Acidobacteriota bacterium]|nr:MAG: hypothetical protein JSV80_14050 [Acidobacteriota bacterium]